jgi:3-ketosteroid 9alpha-monooxygenase subunit B
VEAESLSVLDGRTRARFHPLIVRDVAPETADAVSVAFEIPDKWASLFRYRPGQFVTLRVDVDGDTHLRAYSMCSAPGIDSDLRVTVKRVPGGLVSNWLNDHLVAGDSLEVTPPAGTFVVPKGAADLVAYAAGSGITPILSIITAVLAEGDRRFSLLYANRDRPSTIFARRLDELVRQHHDRLRVVHHFDLDSGFVTSSEVAEFAGSVGDADHFICGPEGFMATVEETLQDFGVDPDNIHLERFTPADASELGGPLTSIETEVVTLGKCEITVRMGKREVMVTHRPGTTILQTARFGDLRAPSSCEAGSCATCMARVIEGQVRMRNNQALTPDEVADGWILTCQAEPLTPSVTVVYE